MPKYLDHHNPAPQIPPEVAQQVIKTINSGQIDPFGVKMLNGFTGGGQAWCYTEAPNADAVCQSHAAMGLPVEQGNVVEVQSYV